MKHSEQPGKWKKRLGGKGLSLEAFVKARNKPRFNPSDVRKHREYYENAKKVQKYRKLANQHSGQEQLSTAKNSRQGASRPHKQQDANANETSSSFHKEFSSVGKRPSTLKKSELKKRSNPLESLRQDFIKKKQEEEKLKREREESLQSNEDARQKSWQTRKVLKAKMFKKTNAGQPLMKHRLEHILESLQRQC